MSPAMATPAMAAPMAIPATAPFDIPPLEARLGSLWGGSSVAVGESIALLVTFVDVTPEMLVDAENVAVRVLGFLVVVVVDVAVMSPKEIVWSSGHLSGSDTRAPSIPL